MRKKLLLALASTVCAISCFFGVVTANAGLVTNNPAGGGLLDGVQLNTTNFKVNEEAETSAYSVTKGNTTYEMKDVPWRSEYWAPSRQIPNTDVVAGAKFTIQFDMNAFAPFWTGCLYLSPFATHEWLSDNYFALRVNTTCTHPLVGPETAEFWLPGKDAKEDVTVSSGSPIYGFGIQGDVMTNQQAKGYAGGTYWLEYDIDTLSMTVYGGNAATGEKTQYGTMKNAFTILESTGYFMIMGFDGTTLEIDNYKVYRTLGEEVTTYCDVDFDGENQVLAAYDPTKPECLYATGGYGNLKAYDSMVVATNPAYTSSINTINPVKVDTSVETTLELTAGIKLQAITATTKVGLGLGLNKYDTSLTAPVGGASFVYLTVDGEGKVVLGVDAIAEDGTATAVGETHVLEGVAVGSNVELAIAGKADGSIDVTVGEATYNYENINLNGHISFAHTGEGDVTYGIIAPKFSVTGYEYKGNDSDEVVTANFDADYIAAHKFAMQSTVVPSEYIAAQDTTIHEISGVVAENGKLGFYGSSTNSRVMFNKSYADYVLQFDYISEPYKTRAYPGGLLTGGTANRYSPLYVLFGAPNEIPELQQCYGIGIVEGNATQYFWGAESLLSNTGKLSGVKVLAGSKEVDTETDETIPAYYVAGEDPKPMMPADNALYSFYNKTTRVKLVVINNNVAMYAAEVSAEGTVGEYVKIYEVTVPDASGYVGFGTDAPGWATLDNVAITPIAKAKALELGLDAVPAVDLVADVAVADMEKDEEPTPLDKPVLTADVAAKKVTWEAVAGAKEYEVVVKCDNEELITQTVTTTEYDMSMFKAVGTYDVAVSAIPENEIVNVKSRGTVKYVIEAEKESTPESTVESNTETTSTATNGGGCGGSISGGLLGAFAVLGAAIVATKKRR